jgi:hypothetical protein
MNVIKRLSMRMIWGILYVIGALCVFVILLNIVTHPSNDRIWNIDQWRLPSVRIDGDQVTIHDIRNFRYASTTSYTVDYYDKIFDLNDLQKVWYVVEPFSGIPGSAHTFLSFEFSNDQFVSISVEIRKEQGESFHPIKGLFNQYEIMYVIADEQDVIKLRSNYRKDEVYLYPIATSPEKARSLFIDMVTRANELREQPEFYNTLTNTCTTNIVAHVNKVSPRKLPFFDLSMIFPEYSDGLAYELGLIDTDLSFEQAREKYHINERAMQYADDPNFSRKIRE